MKHVTRIVLSLLAVGVFATGSANAQGVTTGQLVGKVLNEQDRALVMKLLGEVDAGQRWGVGQAAPDGASVYMKDGWVAGPDGTWAMNASGIVETGGETYILSVYTQHQPGYNWTKVQRAVDLATQALT